MNVMSTFKSGTICCLVCADKGYMLWKSIQIGNKIINGIILSYDPNNYNMKELVIEACNQCSKGIQWKN